MKRRIRKFTRDPHMRLWFGILAVALSVHVAPSLAQHDNIEPYHNTAIADVGPVCTISYHIYSGPWDATCGDLLDQSQADGHHEVLMHNGVFWVEAH